MSDDSKRQKQIEELIADLSNAKEIIFNESLDKKKRAAELVVANKELTFQNEEKEKRAAELVIADKELAFLNKEKEKLVAELLLANKELAFVNMEKQKLVAELLLANKTIVIQADVINAQMEEVIEKQLLEKTLMCIGDAVIASDIEDKVRLFNKVAENLTGWTQKEVLRKPIHKVYNTRNVVTSQKVDDVIAKVIINGQIHQQDHPSILTRKDGKEVLVEDTAALILSEQNQPLGVVFVFRDCTQKWERFNKMEYLSFHDELTGLYNRRFYIEELKRMDTKRNLPLSLIMGDVNGLKLLNDAFGHTAGDELIKKAAHAISEGCRTDDIVARIGGDEFIIVLPKTNAVDAAQVIERIENYCKVEEINGFEVSISFGTDTKVEESQDINDIYKNAEKQMYRQKVR